jgi:hypothetical protein
VTLFQSWIETSEKTPLPAPYRQHENPYLQTLKLAEIQSSTFEQRQARRVRTWFARHPECKQMLLPLDWRDQQLRSDSTLISVEHRASRKWFDTVVGVRIAETDDLIAENPSKRMNEPDALDYAIEMASAISSRDYMQSVLEEYPLVAASDGSIVNKRKPRKEADKHKTHKQEKLHQLELDLRI